jgi:hypothetical protein
MHLLCLTLAVAMLGSSAPAAEGPLHGAALFSLTAPRMGGWRLAVEGRAFLMRQQARPEAGWARLWAMGLQLSALTPERAAARAERSEPGGKLPQWVLLDDHGKSQASGEGLPDLPQVEEALRQQLGALPWDLVESLLRAQPDHGEACLAQAEFALAASARTSFGDYRPMLRYEAFSSVAMTAVEKLVAIPDWPWQVDLKVEPGPAFGPASAVSRDAQSARQPIDLTPKRVSFACRLVQQPAQYQDLFKRMAKQVLAALASDPENPRLQANLAFFLRVLDPEGAEPLLADLAWVNPLPGQAWPPLPLIHAQAEYLRRQNRWAELLNQAQAWSRPVDRLFLDARAWDRQVQREATLRAYAAGARSWQQGWSSLPAALDELREQSGSYYTELARLTIRWSYLPKPPDPFLEDLAKQAALPPLSAPAMPQPWPLWRLDLLEPEDRSAVKAAFERNPRLVQWLPSEYLVVRQPNLTSPWRASLGGELKAEGEGVPLPETLGDLLAAGRPGRLWVASERASMQPEAPGPRRLRSALLLQRLPCRVLEPLLAEDLSLALLGADLGTKEPDENLWFVEARRALPALEAHLRRWPMDGERWGALAFWTSFLPLHRGPVELAENLPTLQRGLSFQLCLPAGIHAQVGEHLQRRKAWVALRAWCEPVWAQLVAMEPRSIQGRSLARELSPTVRSFLDAAYAGLGLTSERRMLQDTGRELEGRAN